jgi:hypothetical protein
MTNAITKTRTAANSDQRENIIQQSQDEKKKGEDDEERDRHLSLIGVKIQGEELIESERKRFGVELTSIPRMTCGTKANEVSGSASISLETTSMGTTEFTSIELTVVVETFDVSTSVSTNTKIEIITETKSIWITNTDVMILNR